MGVDNVDNMVADGGEEESDGEDEVEDDLTDGDEVSILLS